MLGIIKHGIEHPNVESKVANIDCKTDTPVDSGGFVQELEENVAHGSQLGI